MKSEYSQNDPDSPRKTLHPLAATAVFLVFGVQFFLGALGYLKFNGDIEKWRWLLYLVSGLFGLLATFSLITYLLSLVGISPDCSGMKLAKLCVLFLIFGFCQWLWVYFYFFHRDVVDSGTSSMMGIPITSPALKHASNGVFFWIGMLIMSPLNLMMFLGIIRSISALLKGEEPKDLKGVY